jgi:CheY-like chemotaxis protein
VVLRIFQRYLDVSGFDVVAAGGGQEGLHVLRTDPTIGLVLLDLKMPGIDGWTVRREQLADERLSLIPTIVVTGSVEEGQLARRELRPADYLLKPISYDQLIATVARYCARVAT